MIDPTLRALDAAMSCAPLAEVVGEHAQAAERICRTAETLLAPLARAGLEGDLTARCRRAQNGSVRIEVTLTVKP